MRRAARQGRDSLLTCGPTEEPDGRAVMPPHITTVGAGSLRTTMHRKATA